MDFYYYKKLLFLFSTNIKYLVFKIKKWVKHEKKKNIIKINLNQRNSIVFLELIIINNSKINAKNNLKVFL